MQGAKRPEYPFLIIILSPCHIADFFPLSPSIFLTIVTTLSPIVNLMTSGSTKNTCVIHSYQLLRVIALSHPSKNPPQVGLIKRLLGFCIPWCQSNVIISTYGHIPSFITIQMTAQLWRHTPVRTWNLKLRFRRVQPSGGVDIFII